MPYHYPSPDEQVLAMLELAAKFEEDEFGNAQYTFITGVATVVLHLSVLDGDSSVSLSVPAQETPLVNIDLIGCERICVVNDKRGKYLEFIGQHKVEDYSRGKLEKTAGFRLRLEPEVHLEPFYGVT